MKTTAAEIHQNNYVSRKVLKSRIVIACALLLAALFAYAAVSKLITYKAFVGQLHESPITRGFENILAWFVPGIELLIASLLLIRKTRIVGLWASLVLMFGFSVYVFALPTFWPLQEIPCSCGGVISKLTWEQHFWFNAGFTLLAVTGLWLSRNNQKNI